MPHVLIETRREYSEAEEIALMDAVHGALRRAFRIPPDDRHVRLLAHEPHRFACPPGTAQPDRYTQVSIDAFEGRSIDAKRALDRFMLRASAMMAQRRISFLLFALTVALLAPAWAKLSGS